MVTDSSQLTVNFIDDQQVTAEIKGTDASTDLAVLSVKVKDIPSDTMDKIKVATLGSSESIKVGQSVVAIGNALGYGQSVTTGVVSALNREVTVQDQTTGATITNDLIQTDAAINPGNMPEGVYITMVAENSAAEQAGIRKGDVLTSFAGRKVTSMEGLSDVMQYYAAGTEVEVVLQTNQNGEWIENTVTVKLGKKNN